MKKDDRASIPLDEVFAEAEKDPGWKDAYAKADLDMRLSIQIANARERAGLTQGQLAKAVGTTQSVISRIEGANQNLTVNTLLKIASALNNVLVVELHPAERAGTRETASQVRDATDARARKRERMRKLLRRRGRAAR